MRDRSQGTKATCLNGEIRDCSEREQEKMLRLATGQEIKESSVQVFEH